MHSLNTRDPYFHVHHNPITNISIVSVSVSRYYRYLVHRLASLDSATRLRELCMLARTACDVLFASWQDQAGLDHDYTK